MKQLDNDMVNIFVHTHGLENIVFRIADILDESITENIDFKEISHRLEDLFELGLADESRIRVLWDFALILYGDLWNKCVWCNMRKEAAEWFRYLAKEDE